MFKKLLIATIALGCLGLAGFGALAWKPAMAPVARPAAGSFGVSYAHLISVMERILR